MILQLLLQQDEGGAGIVFERLREARVVLAQKIIPLKCYLRKS